MQHLVRVVANQVLDVLMSLSNTNALVVVGTVLLILPEALTVFFLDCCPGSVLGFFHLGFCFHSETLSLHFRLSHVFVHLGDLLVQLLPIADGLLILLHDETLSLFKGCFRVVVLVTESLCFLSLNLFLHDALPLRLSSVTELVLFFSLKHLHEFFLLALDLLDLGTTHVSNLLLLLL